MISRFAFSSFKQVDTRARVRFRIILVVLLAFVFIALHPPIAFLILFGSYALSAPTVWVWRKVRKRPRAAPTPA
jgi:CDP-diacylglycerol--serine O-phosphatidyltransferase